MSFTPCPDPTPGDVASVDAIRLAVFKLSAPRMDIGKASRKTACANSIP